ncbi:hypothetical protein EVAR_94370_1 [Eumeta japonica]|uniref:Uncharacterized protein n=1 Tax=Eumeta variegata TaxID=151549 RepID=A0A4C1TPX8_EUMVA|nr:hypothetical protein EVAR_94370_1 [Eumeta japonica]
MLCVRKLSSGFKASRHVRVRFGRGLSLVSIRVNVLEKHSARPPGLKSSGGRRASQAPIANRRAARFAHVTRSSTTRDVEYLTAAARAKTGHRRVRPRVHRNGLRAYSRVRRLRAYARRGRGAQCARAGAHLPITKYARVLAWRRKNEEKRGEVVTPRRVKVSDEKNVECTGFVLNAYETIGSKSEKRNDVQTVTVHLNTGSMKPPDVEEATDNDIVNERENTTEIGISIVIEKTGNGS